MATYSCYLEIPSGNGDGLLQVSARWELSPGYTERRSRTLTLTLDGRESKSASTNSEKPLLSLDDSSAWSSFIIDAAKLLKQPTYRGSNAAIKFVLPEEAGFCVRSDFLERRLEGLDTVIRVKSFLEPRQEIRSTMIPDQNSIGASHLPEILSFSVGAVIIKDAECLRRTETELDNRLSYPWILPYSSPLRRLAYVRGRYNIDHSERIWESARALGIAVVVIDAQGHWLQQPEWAHLREAFIPANLDPDEGLANRLVAAVKSYSKPIHGITTVSNKRMVAVARACELLGLPTSPSESFAIAADKYRTREIEPATDVTSFRVEDPKALYARLASAQQSPIHYPVVVKPCIGWASECIAKVNTEVELVKAVEKASERHRRSPIGRTDVMVETYIDGPEIDANVVLFDGEILFFEVADDFPSLADLANNKWDDPFQETFMVLPSQLPEDEIQLIRTSLHDTLLRQGFRQGVFNCEGRMRYSRMKYGPSDDDEDLVSAEPSHAEGSRQPSFYLHEINARPPGYYGNVASNITYGVDYYALDFCFAVGDMERYRSLASSFKNGPQWWLVIVVLPEKTAGIMITEDACSEFLAKSEDIKKLVPDHMTWKKRGSEMQGPGASQLGFVGYMSVVSRKSRTEALHLAWRIRREFGYAVA